MAYKMKGFTYPGVSPLQDKQSRQLKRAKKRDRWMHGQEMAGEKGQLKTLEGHSWSTGDKERKIKDPHGIVSDDTPDYPSDDYRYYYKKNPITGNIKLLGKEDYEDLPPIEVNKKKKSPAKQTEGLAEFSQDAVRKKEAVRKVFKKGGKFVKRRSLINPYATALVGGIELGRTIDTIRGKTPGKGKGFKATTVGKAISEIDPSRSKAAKLFGYGAYKKNKKKK